MDFTIEFKKMSIEDISFVSNIRNNYAQEYLHDSRTFSLEETKQWFEKYNPDFWIIVINDQKIGYFRLSNHSIINKNIYIGADISPEYTGRGYGYLSYKEFIPFLFEKYELNKITLEVLSTNVRAIGLYKKLGFKQEGMKREEINKNGKYVDSIIMSILKSEIL